MLHIHIQKAKLSLCMPWKAYTGWVSESGNFATLFFPSSATLGRKPLSPFCWQLQSILVAMEPWTGAQHAFTVKAFYKNGDSLAIAQREFRREFGIHHNRAVPSAHAIKTWVRNFEATGSTLKTKGGSVKTVRTPDNIAVVREAIERSLHHSARRHSVSLGLSEASVRRILHKELNFFPYKIQVTHALHERDYVNRVNFCQTFGG